MKDKFYDPVMQGQYQMYQTQQQESEKTEEFLNQLREFRKITTLSDAKKLLVKILPEAKEKSGFVKCGAECQIVNTDSRLQIVVETSKNHLSYEFV